MESYLNKDEKKKLQDLFVELNTLMQNCAMGDFKSCSKTKKMYNEIEQWKEKKFNTKLEEVRSKEVGNQIPIQVQIKVPSYFDLVNCYKGIKTSDKPMPFEGRKMIRGFVGATSVEKEVDRTILEIEKELASLDTVSGVRRRRTVGASFLENLKIEAKKLLNPIEAVKSMKDAVSANVQAVKDWAAEVKRNPAALARPPLPRTGNKDFDKKILGSIEDIARKTDPAYQIADTMKGQIKDLMGKGPASLENAKIDNAINQTRQQSRAMGIDNATFRQIMDELETKNQGLFLNSCGDGTNKVKSFDGGRFVICKSAAAKKAKKAKPKVVKQYVTVHQKPKGGSMASGTVGLCPSCIIEDLSVSGTSDKNSAENFYRMAGIKHYSGNNLMGKQITKR